MQFGNFENEHEYIILFITHGAHALKIKINENLDDFLLKNVKFATRQYLSLTNFC